MERHKKPITVLLNCYNEVLFVTEAIESILQQTRIDLVHEIVVVDDGSEDGTIDKVAAYQHIEPSVTLIKQPNRGLAAARNRGILHAESEWIAFIDGDDIWLPEKLEKQWDYVQKFPSVGLFYGDSFRFGATSGIAKAKDLPLSSHNAALKQFFRNDALIIPSSVLIRKVVFETVGYFDEELRMAQDTEMWARSLSQFFAKRIPEPLFLRRTHDQSASSKFLEKAAYLKMAQGKIIERFPALDRYSSNRKSSINTMLARNYLKEKKRFKALRHILIALYNRPNDRKALKLCLKILLPSNLYGVLRGLKAILKKV